MILDISDLILHLFSVRHDRIITMPVVYKKCNYSLEIEGRFGCLMDLNLSPIFAVLNFAIFL